MNLNLGHAQELPASSPSRYSSEAFWEGSTKGFLGCYKHKLSKRLTSDISMSLVDIVHATDINHWIRNQQISYSSLRSRLLAQLLKRTTQEVHEHMCMQASTLTQNDTCPVGPVTPSIYWSCKIFTGPTFFL